MFGLCWQKNWLFLVEQMPTPGCKKVGDKTLATSFWPYANHQHLVPTKFLTEMIKFFSLMGLIQGDTFQASGFLGFVFNQNVFTKVNLYTQHFESNSVCKHFKQEF